MHLVIGMNRLCSNRGLNSSNRCLIRWVYPLRERSLASTVYNSKANRKTIFNRKMIPNINHRQCDLKRSGRKQLFDEEIFKERFSTIERLFAWEDKFKRLLIRFERISSHFYAFKMLAYTMINLRHFGIQ